MILRSLFVRRSLTVITVAVAARLFFVFFDPFLAGDSYEYQAIAVNLLGGHGYSIFGSSPTVYRMPLYPLFIAGTYGSLGSSPGLVFLIQVFAGGIGAWLTYLLGRKLVGERAAFVGALLAGTDPHLAWYAATLLAESLTLTLLAATLLGASVLSVSSRKLAVVVGSGFGLVALSSPALAALPAGLVVVLLLRRWPFARLVQVTVLLALGYATTLAPWVARNAVTFGAFIPLIVPQQGLGLWLAAIRQPLYGYDFAALSGREPLMARWWDLYVAHADRERDLLSQRVALQEDMTNDALRRIASDPASFAAHRIRLIPSLWMQPASYASLHSFRQPFETQNDELGDMLRRGLLLPAAARVISTVVFTIGLFGGALVGLWQVRRRLTSLALLLLPAGYIAIFHSLIWIEFRYSLPARPTLWLISAVGLLAVVRAARASVAEFRSRRGLGRGGRSDLTRRRPAGPSFVT